MRSIVKRWNSPVSLAIMAGSCALLLGVSFGFVEGFKRLFNSSQTQQHQVDPPSAVLSRLLHLTPAQRAAPLEALAQLGSSSSIANRARYLLAADLIQQRQGHKALTWLRGLEEDYPILGAEIALKRAQATEQTGNLTEAKVAWQELLQRYPDNPTTAEALYALGRSHPQSWDRAITQFPAHPRTVEIVQARLKQNPDQPQLLLLLARHGLYLPGSTSVLDQLTSQFKDQLKPADWEAIAFGYWEKQAYGKAGQAYTQAPPTPRNAYRAGRGLQLGQKKQEAYKAFQQMVAQFPEAEETPLALIRMAGLAPQPSEALQHLDQAIQLSSLTRTPHHASHALLTKVRFLNRLDRTQADRARQVLLTTYSNSDAAAELRWEEAQKWSARQNADNAAKLAQQITTHNPNSEFAPAATFWSGKWATQLGREAEAKTAFQHVLTHYPDSYYAWRVAVQLGWSVGDFSTVRQLDPQIDKSAQRPVLPVGSNVLKELYQLRQDRDAWTRWQWEYRNPMNRTLEEQFTDGLLRLGVGDYLSGLFMISNLAVRSRQEPETLPQYQTLQQQPGYWQALYPFPFTKVIADWSQARSLNPLLVTALIRQESRFQPTIRSIAGATGLMQVMPGTAEWIANQIHLERYDLEYPEDNVKLGTWYLDYTHQTYNDNSMLAVASYNAGPGNVANWVKQTGSSDPDKFVEAIPFPETKDYVKAVFENYWNYLRLYNSDVSQQLSSKL